METPVLFFLLNTNVFQSTKIPKHHKAAANKLKALENESILSFSLHGRLTRVSPLTVSLLLFSHILQLFLHLIFFLKSLRVKK